MSLPAFLRLVEDAGEAVLPARVVTEAAGDEIVRVLLAGGVLRAAGLVTHYECGGEDGDGCPRRVVRDGAGGALPLVAVCGRSPHGCESVRLAESDVSAVVISLRAFEDAVATLYEAEPIRALAKAGAPLKKLGEQRARGPARDVFLSYRPWDASLADALALRERAARRTLVLVPTARALPSELQSQYGPGGRVELALLEDALDVVDGQLVLATKLPPAEKSRRRKRKQAERGLEMPKLERWKDLSIYKVTEEMVSVRIGKLHLRRTYADLGMASEKTRLPTESWQLLLLVCDGYGRLRVGGQREMVKRRISRLRDDLCSAFGLEDDPFEDYRPRQGGWKSKFVAEPRLPLDSVGE